MKSIVKYSCCEGHYLHILNYVITCFYNSAISHWLTTKLRYCKKVALIILFPFLCKIMYRNFLIKIHTNFYCGILEILVIMHGSHCITSIGKHQSLGIASHWHCEENKFGGHKLPFVFLFPPWHYYPNWESRRR